MQLAIRQEARLFLNSAATKAVHISRATTRRYTRFSPADRGAWTCPACCFQQQIWATRKVQLQSNQPFTVSARQHDDSRRDDSRPQTHISSTEEEPLPSPSTATPETLPSYQAGKRWHMSKRMEHLMNEVLSRVSVASHRINTYTGTDYSGIETLRREIGEQEQRAKKCLAAVQEARHGHGDALTDQTTAQKEIVGLLERKSSWLPADLERYMSLVRSEHVNDQTVQSAKERLKAAERDLEDARLILERLERKQYHEEQIWSDTIRRNSTWVTFGLMGVNIVLLLAQLVVFEPYRRRKIVREVKAALDEKAISHHSILTAELLDSAASAEIAVEPANAQPDSVGQNSAALPSTAGAGLAVEVTPVSQPSSSIPSQDADKNAYTSSKLEHPTTATDATPKLAKTWTTFSAACNDVFWDLFSDRLVQLKKVDVTTISLESTAVGIAATGAVMWFLTPR